MTDGPEGVNPYGCLGIPTLSRLTQGKHGDLLSTEYQGRLNAVH